MAIRCEVCDREGGTRPVGIQVVTRLTDEDDQQFASIQPYEVCKACEPIVRQVANGVIKEARRLRNHAHL